MPELWHRRHDRADLLARVGRLEQAGGVRLVTLGDGSARGVRVLEFRTGSGFAFDVVVDRGFDIGRADLGGVPLAWVSPVGTEGPWFREPEGFGFLRAFGGGLLTTCGLDHTMFPVEDHAGDFRYPPFASIAYGLHGRISGEPARLAGYGERWEGDECILWADAVVEQASVFGEYLVLRRSVETRLGASSLTVRDEVTNAGASPTSHMLLYHVNVGYPLLDRGARLVGPIDGSRSRDDGSDLDPTAFGEPRLDATEQVYELGLAADETGRVALALVNDRLSLGVYQRYEKARLPHHFLWRMLGHGHYVVGIEPGTNAADGRLAARNRDELILLDPGDSRRYELELGVLQDADAIARFEQSCAVLPRSS